MQTLTVKEIHVYLPVPNTKLLRKCVITMMVYKIHELNKSICCKKTATFSEKFHQKFKSSPAQQSVPTQCV